jgi:adenosine deaminase
MEDLLTEIRRRGVTIEIALSSSDLILGVRGKEHPLPTYLAAGVPVVLATDDAGVSRSNLTNEYFRAAHEHGLGYRELKELARNALTYSFLPQPEKARELAQFDRSSTEFERATAKQRPISARLAALIRAVLLGRP